jgi:hypothetical protein
MSYFRRTNTRFGNRITTTLRAEMHTLAYTLKVREAFSLLFPITSFTLSSLFFGLGSFCSNAICGLFSSIQSAIFKIDQCVIPIHQLNFCYHHGPTVYPYSTDQRDYEVLYQILFGTAENWQRLLVVTLTSEDAFPTCNPALYSTGPAPRKARFLLVTFTSEDAFA